MILSINEAYAEGGRATEASVFAEAGPEWAIPEAHSARTAELIFVMREELHEQNHYHRS